MKIYISQALKLMLLLSIPLVLLGCGGGGSNSSSASTDKESVTTVSYKVENVSVTTPTEGKSTFKIKVTDKNSGAAVVGKSITLTPTMDMGATKHSTPFDSFKDNGDGTYTWTLYYLMASTMADGTQGGTWELKFTLGDETFSFKPAVVMAMGTSPRGTLKGVSDMIISMGSAKARSYYLFDDGISGGTVKLFIAAVDDSMMTKYPAVSVGTMLHDQMAAAVPVNLMTVEVSTDKTVWTPLADDGAGHWSKSGLTPLAAGMHLYVRMSVNGEQKTVDGMAVGAGNAYCDFAIAGM